MNSSAYLLPGVCAISLLCAAGADAQSDDALALLRQLADASRATASWRVEGEVVTESKTESGSELSTQPFQLYLQGPDMRYEIGGIAPAITFRRGNTLWEYTPATNTYTRRDNMTGRYITGVLGWDVLAAMLRPTAAIIGSDQVEFQGRNQACELVQARMQSETRTVCVDRSSLFILRDRDEVAARDSEAGQTRQLIRTITYSRIERDLPLDSKLFQLPDGAVDRLAAAPAALPGLTPPRPLTKIDPEYTRQASAARRQGTVAVSVTVGTDGVPRNVTVVRGLGLGLDEKAIEAVRKWRFTPGEKDGQPVAVKALVEVTFRLNTLPQ